MSDRVVPMARPKLPAQVDIPADVREKTAALSARMNRIARVLNAPACLPERKREAKDELAALAKDALNLWSLV